VELTIDGNPANSFKKHSAEALEKIEIIKKLPDGQLLSKDALAKLLDITPEAVGTFGYRNRDIIGTYRLMYRRAWLYGNAKTVEQAKRELNE